MSATTAANAPRLLVRGMRDGRHVLVTTSDPAPRARAMLELSDTLGAGLRHASALLPGTSVEPVALRADLVLEGEGSVLDPVCLGGMVSSPARLQPAQMRAFTDVVAQLLSADGFEVCEPVLVEEGPTEH